MGTGCRSSGSLNAGRYDPPPVPKLMVHIRPKNHHVGSVLYTGDPPPVPEVCLCL